MSACAGVFKSCRKFEAEVCSMVRDMVHGAQSGIMLAFDWSKHAIH